MDNEEVLNRLEEIKFNNKIKLAKYIEETKGIKLIQTPYLMYK